MKSKYMVDDPLLMSGTPCFVGTKVLVKSLLDYLEAGDSLSHFLDQFPAVTREFAVYVLNESRLALQAAQKHRANLRILVDESVPKALSFLIQGHFVRSVQFAGFIGLQNGKLMPLWSTRVMTY
jgi:uncharacterized protein (DUF433 family)